MQNPLRASSRRAPCHGRICVLTATLGAAKRRPKLPCQSALAHSTAPVERLGEGSEGPLWKGLGVPPG
eukprot:10997309-Alexandrium_andersonii.AAC.1